eukprot:CAMPEP_0181211742 /NCGR_PEP_ID=MMETSP1096-20121128/23963_1 /TAXON_ID=156174 ORGANISM="Chrysochromulina ericina, Strain CCMP281" /NCGR_SAMPLE_ID=MMETSP1096 /ASSEMBLY_ACC=CAM_ASM_000453 /LENGTH=55 /DNA_ID=CAMNT_0023303193 /DNA_START=381 /DNA_END=548 /DNA_ORIENTATION=+
MVRAEHDHTAGPALNVVDPVGVKLLWLERLAMELQLVPRRGDWLGGQLHVGDVLE